jgi:deoxyribonuclease-4
MAHIFGTHAVDTGGIDMAARRAAAAGLRAVQIFTAIPKFYGDKSSINPKRVERFHQALADTGIQPEHVVVHAAYVLSVATAEADKWERAAAGLAKEMERSTALGIGAVCFHPGSASDGDPAAAAERVARAITGALKGVKGGTRLLVENTAGAGKTLGRTAAEVGDILRHVPDALRERTGYGLDTCHLYASGYDIAASQKGFTAILDEFEEATGETPGFFHLNDSSGARGSNRDRHMLLGEGEIGVEPFRWLLADRRSRGVPLILETPQENYEPADDDASADPYDLRMSALLEELRKRSPARPGWPRPCCWRGAPPPRPRNPRPPARRASRRCRSRATRRPGRWRCSAW